MALQHENATAIVKVTGLALGCYNRNTDTWEVGFLRHEKHVLTVEVTQSFLHGESRLKFILGPDIRISIDTVNGISAPEPLFLPPGPGIDRHQDPATQEMEDLRWVVDIERELNEGEPVELKAPEVPITQMFVSKPMLYADADLLTNERTELTRLDNPAIKQVFGHISEGCKADITCEDGGGVVLNVEGQGGFSIFFPHRSGPRPHQIMFDNTCPPEPLTQPTSDFKLYYSVIADTKGGKFDLIAPPSQISGPRSICNKALLGVRESLF